MILFEIIDILPISKFSKFSKKNQKATAIFSKDISDHLST